MKKLQLPIASYVVHEILVPSLGKKLRFRPYVVKEEKSLIVAKSAADSEDGINIMYNTVKEVIKSCCVEDNVLEVDKLATFDIVYLLLKLRAISSHNEVELSVTCQHSHDGLPDNTKTQEVTVDINNVEVVGLDQWNPNIKINDSLVIKMKLPTLDSLKNIESLSIENLNSSVDDVDCLIKLVCQQIDQIFTGEEVIDASDYTIDELVEWVNQLSAEQFLDLITHFKTIPFCRLPVEWTCNSCGKTNKIYIDNLVDFF